MKKLKNKKSQEGKLMEFAGMWKDWKEADGIFKKILKRSSRRKPVALSFSKGG